MSRSSLFLAASVGAFLWTIPARAVTTCVPTPLAPCPSDLFEVTDGNGNVLTDINGNVASATLTEGGLLESGQVNGGEVTFNFPGTVANPAHVILTEGSQTDPSGFPIASDALAILSNSPGIAVQFHSDDDSTSQAAVCTTQFTTCIPETGAVQDLTALAFPGGNAPFHILVQSDFPEVPEPRTLLLFGSGLAGLAAIGARRTRA